jgi:hypothetical protein
MILRGRLSILGRISLSIDNSYFGLAQQRPIVEEADAIN